jgi:hypothetical protein
MPDAHAIEVKFASIAENLVYEGLRNPLDVRFFGTPMGAVSCRSIVGGLKGLLK